MTRKGEAYLGGGSREYGNANYRPERPNLGSVKKKRKLADIKIYKTDFDRKVEAFERQHERKVRRLKKVGKWTGRVLPVLA